VIFVASRGAGRNVVHLEPDTFFDGWLVVLGVSDRLEATCVHREVVDCSRASGWGLRHWDDVELIWRTIILVILGTS
jgi:hypothetical protein